MKKIALLFFILLFISCTSKKIDLTIDGHLFSVEVAQTFDERAKGLMRRNSMSQNEGMLFVFEKEQKLSFWMKNTKIPLSIAYINKAGEIKEIYDMEPFSLKPVPSIYSCMYALEVNQGRFEELGIEVGDLIEFDINQLQ